jgi:hypothetical protein
MWSYIVSFRSSCHTTCRTVQLFRTLWTAFPNNVVLVDAAILNLMHSGIEVQKCQQSRKRERWSDEREEKVQFPGGCAIVIDLPSVQCQLSNVQQLWYHLIISIYMRFDCNITSKSRTDPLPISNCTCVTIYSSVINLPPLQLENLVYSTVVVTTKRTSPLYDQWGIQFMPCIVLLNSDEHNSELALYSHGVCACVCNVFVPPH